MLIYFNNLLRLIELEIIINTVTGQIDYNCKCLFPKKIILIYERIVKIVCTSFKIGFKYI